MSKLTVTQMESARIPTQFGEFHLVVYSSTQDSKEHLALIMGDVHQQHDVLVRIHSECYTGDVLGSQRCDCGDQLQRAMQRIADAGCGLLIYLRQEGRGIGLIEKLRAYNLQDLGHDTIDANLLLGHQADERDYTPAVHILNDLDVSSIRLLTNNPHKISSLQEMGVSVSERIPIYGEITHENRQYVQTKVERMDHFPQPGLTNGIAHNMSGYSEPFPIMTSVRQRLAHAPHFSQENGRPYVTLTYAQTLDGCIALRLGQQLNISNQQSHTLTHQLRANHDAILVGIGTVLADNPRLTVRLINGQDPQPIVLDSHLRFPLDAHLLQNARPPWIMTSTAATTGHQSALEAVGAHIFRISVDKEARISLDNMLKKLAELGIQSLMVEGGAQIITSFLRDQVADQALLTIAPMFAGGVRAIDDLHLSDGGQTSSVIPSLANIDRAFLGDDLILRGDLVF